MEQLQWVFSPVGLYTIALLGMFVHFLKKQIKGESIIEIAEYFKVHLKSTIISFVATTIGFLGYFLYLKSGEVYDVFVVFGTGYMADSLFNKWDKIVDKTKE